MSERGWHCPNCDAQDGIWLQTSEGEKCPECYVWVVEECDNGCVHLLDDIFAHPDLLALADHGDALRPLYFSPPD